MKKPLAKAQAGTSVKTVKKNNSKVTLSPNSSDYNNGVYRTTNNKGKVDYMSKDTMTHPDKNSVHSQEKQYNTFNKKGTPTYIVKSSDFIVDKGKIINRKTNFKKSIDTTGYSKGKKTFNTVKTESLPNGNMKKITTTKVNRKDVNKTINKMKNEVKKPFKKK